MYNLKKPVPVTLDSDEVAQTLDFISRMRVDKVAHHVQDKMFDINNTSEGINIIGHLGEMAVGKVLGLSVDMEVRTGGDDGHDMRLGSTTIQVKTSTLPKLIFNASHLFVSEVAILAQFVGEDKTKSHEDPKFLLHGWITRKSFMKYFYRYDFGYGERLIVDAPLLDPLSELLEEYAITTG